jgi:hypothetical protein
MNRDIQPGERGDHQPGSCHRCTPVHRRLPPGGRRYKHNQLTVPSPIKYAEAGSGDRDVVLCPTTSAGGQADYEAVACGGLP